MNTSEDLALLRNPETRQKVINFYNGVTGNPEVTLAIIQACDEADVPLASAFALAGVESGYSIWAFNDNGTTQDRGLFQLNNLSFPELSPQDMFNPLINARHGVRHLKQALKEGKNLTVALAIYNAGVMRVKQGNVPRSTLDYIHLVTNRADTLEFAFAREFPQRVALGNETGLPKPSAR